MPALPYALYDADAHDYEPDDCFPRHIEARFAKFVDELDGLAP